MRINLTSKGDFKDTKNFFERIKAHKHFKNLDAYGQEGVGALASATPADTGLTSNSWDYYVWGTNSSNKTGICWTNSNVNKGISIAALIQYGHATKNGGYVPPTDYINPAMAPILNKAGEDVWMEVTYK